MMTNPRKARLAYAMMVGFMALSTAALVAASASGGSGQNVNVVNETVLDRSVIRDAG